MLGYNLLGYSSILELDRHQAQILVPVLTWQTALAESAVGAGNNITLPTIENVELSTFEPGVSISANIFPPLTTVTYSLYVPVIQAGTYIMVGIAQTQYDLGGIGDTLIGEFSIGEGKLISKQINKIPRLNISPMSPTDIQSGAQILLPEPVTWTLSLAAAEIDSRRRRLRTQVILS